MATTSLHHTLGTGANQAAAGNDSRLSNSREWTGSTVTQAEAEAGTSTTRGAWTAQRVRQAIAAWWITIPKREVLTANRIYYVRVDGNDSNTGLINSSAGAFLTIQKAIDTIYSIDLSIYDAVIQLGDGTYAAGGTLNSPLIGAGTLTIQGNAGAPANVILSLANPGNTTGCVLANNGAMVIVKDLTVTTTVSGYGLFADNNGVLSFENIRFSACGSGHMRVQNQGIIRASGNYSIVGSSPRHVFATGGTIRIQTITITLTGTPAFSVAFAIASINGSVVINANTYVGSATGSRYDANANGVVFSTATLPGSLAGTESTGGVYV